MVQTPEGQSPLFDDPNARTQPAPAEVDIDALRDHYADSISSAMNGRNPRISQEAMHANRETRKTGTYSAEQIPEHLKETMERAEEMWRNTAPGATAVAATEPEVPEFVRERAAAARERKAKDPMERLAALQRQRYFPGR